MCRGRRGRPGSPPDASAATRRLASSLATRPLARSRLRRPHRVCRTAVASLAATGAFCCSLHRTIGLLDRGQFGHRALVLVLGAVTARSQPRRRVAGLVDHAEVDLAAIEIDPTDLHTNPRADAVAYAGAFAAQLLARLVEAEVLATEFGDVHQPFYIQAIELDEQAEARRGTHGATKLLAEVLAHVAALQPGFDIARGLVRPALVGAAMRARHIP